MYIFSIILIFLTFFVFVTDIVQNYTSINNIIKLKYINKKRSPLHKVIFRTKIKSSSNLLQHPKLQFYFHFFFFGEY